MSGNRKRLPIDKLAALSQFDVLESALAFKAEQARGGDPRQRDVCRTPAIASALHRRGCPNGSRVAAHVSRLCQRSSSMAQWFGSTIRDMSRQNQHSGHRSAMRAHKV
ncbi:hypothetical protein NKH37_22230 [Mesorhizobium sp. M1217]|uniref:hypothetical protein n=1 Tax=Mesorhizobium sp. M1217 TaxID=2957070 RepID=UPI003334E16D